MRASGGVRAGSVLSFSPGFCGEGRVKPPTLPAFVSLRSAGSVQLKHPAACQMISLELVLSHTGHTGQVCCSSLSAGTTGCCLGVSRKYDATASCVVITCHAVWMRAHYKQNTVGVN